MVPSNNNSIDQPSQAQFSTVEVGNCKLKLRDDLQFHFQEYRGTPCYLIEDEFNVRFYRVGLSEYHLISQLDGSNTLAEAVARSSSHLGEDAIGEQEAGNVFKWLIENGLATTSASRSSARLNESFEAAEKRKNKSRLNPLTPRIPLFNPDNWLAKIHFLTGWLLGLPGNLIWASVLLTGCYHVYANWDQLIHARVTVFSHNNWIWLLMAWMLLKLVHEIAHGVACKRHGGEVKQCGLVLILLFPLPFVDVTSSWKFRSKWSRMSVAFAGMYVELFVAAIAAIVWSNAEIGVVKQQALNLMITGSLTTILFNANPLMRFDGYYILADWLELPNLASHGQQWLKWIGKRYLLGMNENQPTWPEGRSGTIALYAVLSFWWKVLISIGLFIIAESLFFGAGILLAGLAVVTWVLIPVLRLMHFVFIGKPDQARPSRLRFCGIVFVLIACGWYVWSEVPYHGRVGAHAIVESGESKEVRSAIRGFVKDIRVSIGQTVNKGDCLAVLENYELMANIEKLQIERAMVVARLQMLRDSVELAACEAEGKNLELIEQKLIDQTHQKAQLTIQAPIDGIVTGEELKSLLGTFLSPGELICSIQSNRERELQALVAQEDYDFFYGRLGKQMECVVWGGGATRIEAHLAELNSRAQSELVHPALGAIFGGPMPVRYQPVESDSNNGDQMQTVLLEPHFLARLRLKPGDGLRLKSGQPAIVYFRTAKGTVGDVLTETFWTWIRQLRDQAQESQLL